MARRVAVVTGSNKGIGYGIVRALCKQLENGIVYLTARNEDRGKAAVEELKKEKLNPLFHQLDINDQTSVERLRDHLVREHGGLDILVNNAAIAFSSSDSTPFKDQASVTIKTNFTATLGVCNILFPVVKDHGRICHVVSGAAPFAYNRLGEELKQRFKAARKEEEVIELMQEFVKAAQDGTHRQKGWTGSCYGTSKLGVTALTRVQGHDLQADQSRSDILVNCCHPGIVDTDMTKHKGPMTIDQGAECPVYLAMLPSGAKEPQGKYLNDKKQVQNFW